MHPKTSQQPDWYLLPLSGPSSTDLQQKSSVLTRYVQQYPNQTLAQIAASLNREMVDQPYRQAVLATDTIDLMAQLAKLTRHTSCRIPACPNLRSFLCSLALVTITGTWPVVCIPTCPYFRKYLRNAMRVYGRFCTHHSLTCCTQTTPSPKLHQGLTWPPCWGAKAPPH